MSKTIEQKCISKGVKQTEQRKIIARVMSEYKKGTLKSSSGKKVTSKKQAKAIGLSMDSKAHGKKKK